jgi:hypothetical protein
MESSGMTLFKTYEPRGYYPPITAMYCSPENVVAYFRRKPDFKEDFIERGIFINSDGTDTRVRCGDFLVLRSGGDVGVVRGKKFLALYNADPHTGLPIKLTPSGVQGQDGNRLSIEGPTSMPSKSCPTKTALSSHWPSTQHEKKSY